MNRDFNRGYDGRSAAAGLGDLAAVVLRVLQGAIGRSAAISRKDLVRMVRTSPSHRNVSERQVRLAINEIRNSGAALVLSTGGWSGGYWLAASYAELDEFISSEIDPRALGLLATKNAMLSAAHRLLGPRHVYRQGSMFDK